MRRSLVFALCLCFAVASVPAVPRPQAGAQPVATRGADPVDAGRPAIHVFRDKDGLPQNSVMALAYDRQQYLWIGTQDGLAVYNGRTWTVRDLPNRTISNFARSMLIASDDSVWVGRENGGVARLSNGEWATYDEASGFPASRVDCLLETKNAAGEQVIWAGSRAGLARFERGAWKVFTTADGLPADAVLALCEATVGGARVLLAATRGGLARFDGERWAAAPSPFGDEPAGCLFEASASGAPELWAGSATGRLARFDGASWAEVASPVHDEITCMAETLAPGGKRALWVGTDGHGLLRWQDGYWRVFDTEAGMANNTIWSLMPVGGRAGTTTLWVGTDSGAARMELGRWTSFDTGTGLPTDSVYALAETVEPDGTRSMWIGTRGGGIARVRRGEWTVYDTSKGLPNNTVFSMIWATNDDGTHTLWAGTQGGVARFENERWVPVVVSARVSTVRNFIETTGEGGKREIWGATGGGGLLHYRDGAWTSLDASEGLPLNNLFCVVEAPAPGGKRALWVGTQGRGIARRLDGVWTVYDAVSGTFPNNSVIGLHATVDARGRNVLWAGTEGGGAARLDLDDPEARWEVFSDTTTLALPNNTVYQICEDARRRLYLFTNRGVARLTPREPTDDDPSEFRLFVFGTEDGLPSNEFNGGSSFVDSTGRIWGGTPQGATVYDPSGEIEDDAPPPLYVERRQIGTGDRSVAPGDSLRYNENTLSFEYALLSYFREKDTRYRTQLVGLEEAPTAWTADFKRAYTTLPPGPYTFRVWAMDYAGTVVGPVEIPFEIRQAPWKTWWAWLIYLLLLAGATYLLVRYRLAALRRRNEELERTVAERTAELAVKVEELEVSERAALEAKEDALEANRAKSVFLSNMSHELRTPLNAVLGFAQLMDRERDRGKEDRESLEIIVRSGEHLLGLINDVLSISKIEAGKLTLNDQAYDLRRQLQGLEEMIGVRARAKELHVVFDLAPDLPEYVRGDEGKLRQVLLNLLGNAVKFTDEGGVSLRARWEDGRAHFEIEDTGPGIAESEVGSIFDAFVQSESGRTAKKGTGLGLAVSETFVELMGGEIRVRSQVGLGTVFSFDVALPRAVAADLRRSPRRVAGLAEGEPAYRILVTDDRWENRALLVKLLTQTGFEVREAVNGAEAVDVWAEWRPDLIFMDMRMPVMTGLEATREIREREGVGSGVRIVALTASAFEHERGAVLAGGCDDFVTKPYREATIFEKLTEHIGAQYRYEETDDEAPAPATDDDGALTSDRLTALPRDLVAGLHEALTIGNVKEAQFAVDNIGQHDAPLADELRRLVRSYQFDEILDTIEAAGLV